METQFSALLLTSFLLIILFLCRLTKPKNKSNIQIPPGPWKLPLLGNLHQLIAASRSSPSPIHHILLHLSLKYGPLMHLQIGQLSTIVVSSPDMAEQIMKTHDLAFVHRSHVSSSEVFTYGYTNVAFAPYGDYWRQMKKICTLELLSVKRVQSFSSVRQHEVLYIVIYSSSPIYR